MKIREMNINDVEEVKELARITWLDTYNSILPLHVQKQTLDEAYSQETMDERFRTSHMLVAVDNEKIAGYAFFSYKEAAKVLHLESLYVRPDVQQNGIGKALFDAGVAHFPLAKRMTLYILKGNESLPFYQKLEFEYEKEVENSFSGYPVTFMRMGKRL
ncbi:N-acetyltransferase [Halobacillus fulvus]|nr:N-acetyltransferase [Halobacillus fulvus]